MWQKVAKFKGAEYFRKALYITNCNNRSLWSQMLRECEIRKVEFQKEIIVYLTHIVLLLFF